MRALAPLQKKSAASVAVDWVGLVDASVPIIRASAGVYVELLPGADAIQLPLVEAVADFENRMDAAVLQIQIADEQAKQMRRVRGAAGVAERRVQGDRSENRDAPLRRNPEDEQQDRAFREVHRVREQQPVNRARRADDRNVAQLLGELERQEREEHRQHGGADAGDEVELQKKARAPHLFELRAEHPQREHVEQDVKDPAVQEHVRDGLPQPQLVHERVAAKAEHRRQHWPGGSDQQPLFGEFLSDEDRDVRGDERFQRGRDRPWIERNGAGGVTRRIAGHAKGRIVLYPDAAVRPAFPWPDGSNFCAPCPILDAVAFRTLSDLFVNGARRPRATEPGYEAGPIKKKALTFYRQGQREDG